MAFEYLQGRTLHELSINLLRCKGILLAHCQLGVHQNPRGHFLSSCFPAGWPPVCAGAWHFSFPGTGLCTSPGWNSWGSCQPISPACQALSGWQHSPLVYQPLLPVLYRKQTCWGHTLLQHPDQIKMDRTGPSVECWGTPLVMGLQLDFVLLITILWAWPFSHFSVPFKLAEDCSSSP